MSRMELEKEVNRFSSVSQSGCVLTLFFADSLLLCLFDPTEMKKLKKIPWTCKVESFTELSKFMTDLASALCSYLSYLSVLLKVLANAFSIKRFPFDNE